jgi:acetyltransferase
MMSSEPRTRVAPRKAAEGVERDIRVRYPEDDDCEVVDLGADRFILRAIRPEDRRAYFDFIARMDETDLRQRFAYVGEAASKSDFAGYTHPDHHRERSLVAVGQSGPSKGDIVGEVRAYQYAEGSTVEVAVIVRSDMQGCGLGSALMARMIEYCRADGLEVIAQIRPENTAMIRLAKRFGMDVEHAPGSDLAIAHLGGTETKAARKP